MHYGDLTLVEIRQRSRDGWLVITPTGCTEQPIETAIQEVKSELGMEHYAVRGWAGWHRHMTVPL